MVQSLAQSPMSFEDFLDWYPDDGRRYELTEESQFKFYLNSFYLKQLRRRGTSGSF